MMTLENCTDYIITKTSQDDGLSFLKLHKLVYYAQAWHLALNDTRLFDGKFEAWVHGPVSRALYKRFASTKYLYSAMKTDDVLPGFKIESLRSSDLTHVDDVLEVYAGLTGTQLENLTHSEEPWIRARGGLPPAARCDTEINEDVMRTFYRSQLPSA